MEDTVVVQVKPGKSVGIRGIQIEHLGAVLTPDWMILDGAGKAGKEHGDIFRAPRSYYEANKGFLDLVVIEAPAAPVPAAKPVKKAAPVKEPQPAEAAEADPTEAPAGDKKATLEAMTYQQLKDMAKDAGITWTKVPSKVSLIDQLMGQA